MILPMFKEAWISMISNKLRSILTILGVVIGICAVVLMVAAGQAIQMEIDRQLEGIGGNLMLVTPAQSTRGGISTGRGGKPTLTFGDMKAVEEIKGVTGVAPLVTYSFQVASAGQNWRTTVIGTNTQYTEIMSFNMQYGSLFTERDVWSGTPVAVIGRTVADKLFIFGEDPVGQDIRIRGIPFRVIGVLAAKGANAQGTDQDDMIILPVQAFKRRLTTNRFPDMVALLFITFDDPKNMKMIERRIETLLQVRHRIAINADDDFEIINLTEMVQRITTIGLMLTILLASIASISLFVGSIGIMNMMLTSVTERTKEIGIRKAIGAPNQSILFQFLMESILISAIGSFIGMVLGIVLSQSAGHYFNKPVPVSVLTIVASVVAALVVGVLSGIVPAIKATNLDPIEALRYQ